MAIFGQFQFILFLPKLRKGLNNSCLKYRLNYFLGEFLTTTFFSLNTKYSQHLVSTYILNLQAKSNSLGICRCVRHLGISISGPAHRRMHILDFFLFPADFYAYSQGLRGAEWKKLAQWWFQKQSIAHDSIFPVWPKPWESRPKFGSKLENIAISQEPLV